MPKYEKNKFTANTNYQIRSEFVRVIESGSTPRIMRTADAVSYAKSKNLDLVEIGYDKANHCSNCKVIDYGKYKYELQKREKNAKKAARAAIADVKEVCFTIRIEDGDKKTKLNHIKEFLSDGKTKVKVTVKLARREMHLSEIAKDLMRSIMAELDGLAALDGNPTFNGNILSCVLRPTPNAKS